MKGVRQESPASTILDTFLAVMAFDSLIDRLTEYRRTAGIYYTVLAQYLISSTHASPPSLFPPAPHPQNASILHTTARTSTINVSFSTVPAGLAALFSSRSSDAANHSSSKESTALPGSARTSCFRPCSVTDMGAPRIVHAASRVCFPFAEGGRAASTVIEMLFYTLNERSLRASSSCRQDSEADRKRNITRAVRSLDLFLRVGSAS